MKKPSKTNWERVDSLRDEEINYSDIPKLEAPFFRQAVPWPESKKQITLRLDPDVLGHFRRQGRGYQTAINTALREYVERRGKSRHPGSQPAIDVRPEMYINPIVHIHSTLADAKEFNDTYGPYSLWGKKQTVAITEVAQGKRNLLIGEPGVGKTLLLAKLGEFFDAKGISNCLITLKDRDSISLIDQSLSNSGTADFALLLDGLDEVKGSLFPSILEKIENISKTAPHVAIYISSRSVFMNRYGASFPEYRVITLSPFTQEQVKEYLVASGHDG